MESRTPEQAERLRALGGWLRRRFDAQASARAEIEQRWLDDLDQYHGRYGRNMQTQLERDHTGASRVFVNLTRPRCKSLVSRMIEMMFPSDDRNFELAPTPKPESLLGDIEQVKAAAKAMQTLIDDQLGECDYQEQSRIAINWAVLLGTGILKGPLIDAKIEKTWLPLDPVNYALDTRLTHRPTVVAVSPWDWFPDMSATRMEDCEFFFERRIIGRKGLRALARNPQYDTDAIRRVLREQPRDSAYRDSNRAELRARAGNAIAFDEQTYDLIEYRGSIEREDAEALGVALEGDDPLTGVEVVIEFVADIVIRVQMHPLETEEPLYSAFNLVEDESCIFGYGMPYILRAPQAVVNAAWRMMVTDANYSIGTQVVINREKVVPADGEYALAPRKIWFFDDPVQDVRAAFQSISIDCHQPQLMNIYLTAKQLIEEESQLPSLMQGEMGQTPIQTASGMSMLANNATVALRDFGKNWDERVTEPLITRFYDYNMQYSTDPAVKGDFKVTPRGSSALMVKETQVPSLLQLGSLAQQPGFAGIAKFPELFRALIEAMKLPPDRLAKTDEELIAEQQAMQQQAAADPALAAQQADTQRQAATDAEKHQLDYQIHAEKLASQERIKALDFRDKAAQREFDLLKQNIQAQQAQHEMALKRQMGSGI